MNVKNSNYNYIVLIKDLNHNKILYYNKVSVVNKKIFKTYLLVK